MGLKGRVIQEGGLKTDTDRHFAINLLPKSTWPGADLTPYLLSESLAM